MTLPEHSGALQPAVVQSDSELSEPRDSTAHQGLESHNHVSPSVGLALAHDGGCTVEGGNDAQRSAVPAAASPATPISGAVSAGTCGGGGTCRALTWKTSTRAIGRPAHPSDDLDSEFGRQAPALIFLDRTRSAKNLSDCEVEAVLAALGYYASDLEILRKSFKDSLPSGQTTMNRESFARFMSSIGLNLEGESLERYFSAFDWKRNGVVDVREFLLGLAASDPSVTTVNNGCAQWQRVRLEGVFSLYDADGDGVMNAEEFAVMVRHMLRTAGQACDANSVRKAVAAASSTLSRAGLIARHTPANKPDAHPEQHLKAASCTGISSRQFMIAAASGLFEAMGLPMNGLFKVPPFREIVMCHPDKSRYRPKSALKRDSATALRTVNFVPGENDGSNASHPESQVVTPPASLRERIGRGLQPIEIPESSSCFNDASKPETSSDKAHDSTKRRCLRVNTGVEGDSPRVVKYIPASGPFRPLPEELRAGHHHSKNARKFASTMLPPRPPSRSAEQGASHLETSQVPTDS